MPQHQLIRTEAAVVAVRITISEPPDPAATGYIVNVSPTWSTGVTATVHEKHWQGLYLDLLNRLVDDVTTAYLYGERGDIQRAIATVWKAAGKHARAHEYDEHPLCAGPPS